MTKSLKILTICTILFATIISCDKNSSEDNWTNKYNDEEQSINLGLVGSWDIDKYEAINKGGKVYKSVTDPSLIRAGYWRINFSKEGEMKSFMGPEDDSVLFDYVYYPSSNTVRFNTYGSLNIVSLNPSILVFDSEFFAPEESWYDDAVIAYIRVYCSKSTN